MKIKRLAMALDRGRVVLRRAQACGLVSRTITRREGVVAADYDYQF